MAADWYADAREAITSCLSSVLAIDDRLNNPDRTNDGILLPEMAVDERARLHYFTESDRLQLAMKIRNLASSTDWNQVVALAEAATEAARKSSRAAYDERMTAIAASTATGGTV